MAEIPIYRPIYFQRESTAGGFVKEFSWNALGGAFLVNLAQQMQKGRDHELIVGKWKYDFGFVMELRGAPSTFKTPLEMNMSRTGHVSQVVGLTHVRRWTSAPASFLPLTAKKIRMEEG